MGGVKILESINYKVGDGQAVLPDALHDALGNLVAAVIAVMGVFSRVGEGLVGGVGSEGFVEGRAHLLKVNQGDVLLPGNEADGVGIAAEGIADFAAGVKGAAADGGAEDGKAAAAAGFVNNLAQVGGVGLQRVGGLAFHVVVPELDEEIIAAFHQAPNVFEAPGAEGGGDA